MTGSQKINTLCKNVIKITDEDIAEMREVAQKQSEYVNPLRMATMGWQRELSEHNTRVLGALVALRDTILLGDGISKPPKVR